MLKDRGNAIRIALGLLLALALGAGIHLRSACIENPSLAGNTMGTTYAIRIAERVGKKELRNVVRLIDAELKEINRQMSTWDGASEISRFNHSSSTNPASVSPGFSEVVGRALELGRATDGAFDPTLQPLLNLWGFGSEGEEHGVPSPEAIAATKTRTGWWKVAVLPGSMLQKEEPEISLDLGAIAKGYGVDAVARILAEAGFENWFVEIGGEVVVRGTNPEGVPWKIGIQYPSTVPFDGRHQGVLHLSRGAVATSGNYRNYRKVDDVLYTHILDPRTGQTVRSDAASVTVFAANCTEADGIATALFVMGPENGLAWVENRPGVEAMYLLHDAGGGIIEKLSSGFRKATGYIPSPATNAPVEIVQP